MARPTRSQHVLDTRLCVIKTKRLEKTHLPSPLDDPDHQYGKRACLSGSVTLQEFDFYGTKIHVGWRYATGPFIFDYRADYRAMCIIAVWHNRRDRNRITTIENKRHIVLSSVTDTSERYTMCIVTLVRYRLSSHTWRNINSSRNLINSGC